MGIDIHALLRLINIVLPVALQAAGVPAVLVPAITQASLTAEQVLGAGADKKALVLATAADAVDLINAANAVRGEARFDFGNVSSAVCAGIDVGFAAINAIHDLHDRKD